MTLDGHGCDELGGNVGASFGDSDDGGGGHIDGWFGDHLGGCSSWADF